MVMSKDAGLCSGEDGSDSCIVGMDSTAASNETVETLGISKPKRKRKRIQTGKKARSKRQMQASEQGVAKDRERHSKRAAYATSTLKVGALKHSAAAYAGNGMRQGGIPLPQGLGCGYRLVKCTPG
jgi:hypothetical protein